MKKQINSVAVSKIAGTGIKEFGKDRFTMYPRVWTVHSYKKIDDQILFFGSTFGNNSFQIVQYLRKKYILYDVSTLYLYHFSCLLQLEKNNFLTPHFAHRWTGKRIAQALLLFEACVPCHVEWRSLFFLHYWRWICSSKQLSCKIYTTRRRSGKQVWRFLFICFFMYKFVAIYSRSRKLQTIALSNTTAYSYRSLPRQSCELPKRILVWTTYWTEQSFGWEKIFYR